MTTAHLGILLISLLGFLALALATERWAYHLLRRVPTLSWRLLARVVGWGLLALSLVWAMARFGAGVGLTLWLGWVSLAALALVFAFPKWPWQPPVRVAPARNAKPVNGNAAVSAGSMPSVSQRMGRWWAVVLLLVVPLVYALTLQSVPVKPLLRADAHDGQIGPWTFRLAETDQHVPKLVAMGVPMKSYQIRFCERCDLEIRAAFLKVNKPRSLRASGIGLVGERWDRSADIQLPGNTTADSELWLTVVGKDGVVHQTSVRIGDVSPATGDWFRSK
jgi:hypothetical protein